MLLVKKIGLLITQSLEHMLMKILTKTGLEITQKNMIGLSAKNISSLYLFQVLKYKNGGILQLDISRVQSSIKVPHLLSQFHYHKYRKILRVTLSNVCPRWKGAINKSTPYKTYTTPFCPN